MRDWIKPDHICGNYECEDPANGKYGLCQYHTEVYGYHDPDFRIRYKCKHDGCENPAIKTAMGLGLCVVHYTRQGGPIPEYRYHRMFEARRIKPKPTGPKLKKSTLVPPPARPGCEYSRQLTREPLAYDPPTLPSLWSDLDEASKRLDQAKLDHDQGKIVGYEAFVRLTVAASHFARAQQKIILERMIAERELTKATKTQAEHDLEASIAAWSPDGWSI